VRKTYTPKVKRVAFALVVAFNVIWLIVLAAPLLVFRRQLMARPDVSVVLLAMFIWLAWSSSRYAFGIAKGISKLPLEPVKP
jgi:hypothetical protein